jgi:hypothetical protein
MPWGEEQDKLMQEARLSLASPGFVFQELKKFSAGTRGDLYGNERLETVLAKLTALMRNPSVDEDLLEALYERSGIFAQMPEERWRELVSLSCENKRLVTEEHYVDSPDLGLMGIQKAIFRLLEIAPVSMEWLWVLYDLLNTLAPEQVATPEKIDHVLARWAALDDRGHDGKAIEGHITSLSIKDEFRCLIAALYARSFCVAEGRWAFASLSDNFPIGPASFNLRSRSRENIWMSARLTTMSCSFRSLASVIGNPPKSDS